MGTGKDYRGLHMWISRNNTMKKVIIAILVLLIITVPVVVAACYTSPKDTLISIGIDSNNFATDANVLLYRSPINDRYYAIDCETMSIIEDSYYLKPVWETGFNALPTNGKIIGGGAGGWYSDETLIIKGKAHPKFGTHPSGFQECVIDFEKIEFVMTGDKNRDFIQIDSALGCIIRLGVIAASPNEGHAAVRVVPRLPVQYSQSIGIYGLNLDIVMLSGVDSNGTGLALGGGGTSGPLRGVDVRVNTMDGYKKNFVLAGSVYENFNCDVNIITNTSSLADAVLVTIEAGSGFNHRIKSSINTRGIGAIISGYDSKYEFNVTECAPDSAFILNASRNLVIASGLVDLVGWTDNGNNKVITPGN